MANNTPIAEDAAPTTLHGGPPDTCWPDPFDWWPVIVAVLFVIAVLYI